MTTVKRCDLVNPGLSRPELHVIDPEALTQVWKVTFNDGFMGEIHISPVENLNRAVREMVTELAELLYSKGRHQFPYSTNNLRASLQSLRRL